MPTITVSLRDLEALTGRRFGRDPEVLAHALQLVKGEVKARDQAGDELRIELSDTNRPDLWSCEGVARQLRTWFRGRPAAYPCFARSAGSGRSAKTELVVSRELRAIRPFIGAFIARGPALTHATLAHLIQTQEKLADVLGRKRRTMSLGLYRLPAIRFPISYTTADADTTAFVPLGGEEPMTLREILARHPKGVEYGTLLTSGNLPRRLPLLVDAAGRILSFPPIINSREAGEVAPGDRELIVEATGTDLRLVLLALNTMAANLADRGARIEPVRVRYPYATPFGRTVVVPHDLSRPVTVTMDEIEAMLGEALSHREVRARLRAYGYQVAGSGRRLRVVAPPYRDDLMHPVDVIEDLAISRGYQTFRPALPAQFTVGRLSAIEQFADRVRGLMIGFGFQEMISNILISEMDDDRMGRPSGEGSGQAIEIENVLSQQYSRLRSWLLPSLLRVEAVSSRSVYPHRLFEVGETAVRDDAAANGSHTVMRLGALLAHPEATFSELHAVLDLFFWELGIAYSLEPVEHPSFIEGRAGRILVTHQPVGLIGEVHPAVLDSWQIGMPVSVFDLALDRLVAASG